MVVDCCDEFRREKNDQMMANKQSLATEKKADQYN